jgi:hypothetical protein
MPQQVPTYNPTMQAPTPVVMTMPQQTSSDLLGGLNAYASLLVKQKPRGWCLEYLCGCESENEYGIFNPASGGGKILLAKEHSSWLARNCLGSARPYDMTVNTMDNREIVRYERPYHGRRGGIFCCCCEFCFQVVRVFSGKDTANPGKRLGYVRENYSFCVPEFSLFDENDNEVYKIVGNCCGACNYTLHIFDRHGGKESQDSVGIIQKRWSGMFKELFTDADNFFITFPGHATAEERALLLGALFLIDFLFFENNQRDN